MGEGNRRTLELGLSRPTHHGAEPLRRQVTYTIPLTPVADRVRMWGRIGAEPMR